MCCLVPRGSQGHRPIQKTWPKKYSRIHFQPGPSLGPHTQPANSRWPSSAAWSGVALREWFKSQGRQFLEHNQRIQGFVSHSSPPLRRGPGHNLSSSSPGFLLLVGWGLVEQWSLKGSQSVNKSHLSLPKGPEAEGRTLAGPSCFRACRNSRRQKELGRAGWTLATLALDICLGMLFCDFLHQWEIWALCSKERPFQKSTESLNMYPDVWREQTKVLLQRTGGLGVGS